MITLEDLILFQMIIFHFGNIYDDETLLLRKYKTWVVLKNIYRIMEKNL